ncbi:MAG: hypothetical protein IJD16_10305 [Desulfovibrio sp.]|nr:hypothetical protein [Desulfovibrio sp.]
MNGFHGSVLHILEYADYLCKKGHSVHIASLYIDENFKNIVKNFNINIKIFSIKAIHESEKYDIIWSYHLIFLPYLLEKGVKYNKIIYGSLSSFLKIERIPIFYKNLNLISCVSQEIINMYHDIYGIDKNFFTLIPNHIPEHFENKKKILNSKLKNIAVVSNHPPKEILQLDTYKYNIDYYGTITNTNIHITPEILLNYDVIISIGKTVQYSLALGIPIYEYDHFGGCGYINLQNIYAEELTNFSGRGTKKILNSNQLLYTIEHGYEQACDTIDLLRSISLERYNIQKLIEKQLYLANQSNNTIIMNSNILLYNNTCSASIDLLSDAYNKILHLNNTNKYLQSQINNIQNSLSMRITSPLRKIRKFFINKFK